MAPKIPTLSLTEIAAELEVTTRTVQNYVRDGMPHRREQRTGDPKFVARECQRWRREKEIAAAVEKERDRLENAGGLDKDAEQAEKTRVERQIKELELARIRGTQVPVEQYDERLEAFVGGFVAVSSGQLHRFERDIIAAATPGEARKLTDRILTALMEGSREYADQLEAELQAVEPEVAA